MDDQGVAYCTNCGAKNDGQARYCPACGKRIEPQTGVDGSAQQDAKEQVPAIAYRSPAEQVSTPAAASIPPVSSSAVSTRRIHPAVKWGGIALAAVFLSIVALNWGSLAIVRAGIPERVTVELPVGFRVGQDDAASSPALAAQTTVKYLSVAVNDAIGDTANTRDAKQRVRGVMMTGVKGHYLVTLNGDQTKMPKEGMWLNSKRVWAKVFTERSDVEELVIYWYFPLVDVKGNTSDRKVMSLVMTKENAAGVNWDNVILSSIPALADDYDESPVFNN